MSEEKKDLISEKSQKNINNASEKERKSGRPKKMDSPQISWDDIDCLLVHGDKIIIDGTDTGKIEYPSFRELSERFGVSHSLIGRYSKQHNCMARRNSASKRVKELADTKLIELRADELAMSRDDAIRIIDRYLVAFEQALNEGRVRCDNPTDFNTMVRLKAFIMGDADSRHELVQGVTLETLQEAHRRMLEMEKEMTPETCGVVPLRVVEAEVIRDNEEDKDEQGDQEDDDIDVS